MKVGHIEGEKRGTVPLLIFIGRLQPPQPPRFLRPCMLVYKVEKSCVQAMCISCVTNSPGEAGSARNITQYHMTFRCDARVKGMPGIPS